ncbi:hypothetical protein ACF3NT_11480 [Naumannella halotolerans]|uniref:hypothetical protein n=1 Tax=Naumannella halotolerans TaxID=993414 RepID=UPI001061F9C3|nr:hypothetical protein [Naumannella halotolerans]
MELAAENYGELDDVDIIFTGRQEDGSVSLLDNEGLSSNELWTQIPAVQQENIVPYNYEMQYGSPSGQDAFLTIVEEALLG